MEELVSVLDGVKAAKSHSNSRKQSLVSEELNTFVVSPENIIIPQSVADGLDGWKCEIVKEATATIQSNMIVMGHCLASTAKSLHQLKSLIPRSNWIAFLDSGMIPIKRATALNLVKSYEVIFSKGILSDGEAAYISAQSLGKIARANNPEVTTKVAKKLKAGERVTEKEVDKMLQTAKGLMDDLDTDNAASIANKMMDIVTDVAGNNALHKTQEAADAKKISVLSKKIADLQENISELKKENAELKAELNSLKKSLAAAV